MITAGDHRIAMAFAVLGRVRGARVRVDDPGCADVSFPGFTTPSGIGRGDPMTCACVAIDGPAASGKRSTAGAVARARLSSRGFRRALPRADPGGPRCRPRPTASTAGASGERRAARPRASAGRRGPRAAPRRGARRAPDPAPEVTAAVSAVSAMPAVRDWVNARMRALARRGCVVVDGRDIGTAVFPDAVSRCFSSPRRRCGPYAGWPARGGAGAEAPAEADRMRPGTPPTPRGGGPAPPRRDAVRIDTSRLRFEDQVEGIVALARAGL